MASNNNQARPPEDWDKICDKVIERILTQGETYIKAQMQLALDADKRAIAFGSSSVAFSAAMVAATLVAYNKDAPYYLMAPEIVAATISLFAAILFFISARPILLQIPGNKPENWWVNADKSLKRLLGSETVNYQITIEENDRFLKQNSTFVWLGMIVFATTPIFSLAIFFAFLPF